MKFQATTDCLDVKKKNQPGSKKNVNIPEMLDFV